MNTATVTEAELETCRAIEPELIDLKTQLVSEGMTVNLLAQGDHSTLRIHCYAPSRGEDHGLHAHMEEDHVFLVMHGCAQFYSIKGKLPLVRQNQGIFLPKGCFYEFYNPEEEPLVVLRFGATAERMLRGSRLTPDGEPIPGRSTKHPHLKTPTFIEGKFFE